MPKGDRTPFPIPIPFSVPPEDLAMAVILPNGTSVWISDQYCKAMTQEKRDAFDRAVHEVYGNAAIKTFLQEELTTKE